MNLKWAISTSLTLAVTCALAQPAKIQDRHPAYAADPIVPRVVPIERIHSFEQRWEPVEELLRRQRALGLSPPIENAPAALPAPMRALPERTKPRAAARVADRAKAGDVCFRHGMVKMMVDKYRWRCRR